MASMQRQLSRRSPERHGQRGATAVEFALTAPLAFMLMLAAVEFARVNMIRNSLVNAAYTGARRAMVPGATGTVATAEAKKVLTLCGIQGGQVTVTPSTITATTPEVTVQVRVSLKQNAWVTPMFMKDDTYTRTCTLSREQAKR
jgi:Flp pilus assembly protein TadG